jgi:hypothetical protein
MPCSPTQRTQRNKAVLDYEAEYNNRARVPEHPEIGERWSLL